MKRCKQTLELPWGEQMSRTLGAAFFIVGVSGAVHSLRLFLDCVAVEIWPQKGFTVRVERTWMPTIYKASVITEDKTVYSYYHSWWLSTAEKTKICTDIAEEYNASLHNNEL